MSELNLEVLFSKNGKVMLKEVIKDMSQEETCGYATRRCYHARVKESWTMTKRWKHMLT